MDSILEEVLKLDLQNWINSMWLPDPFTENSALHMLFTNSKNLYRYFFQVKFKSLLQQFYILWPNLGFTYIYPRHMRRSHLLISHMRRSLHTSILDTWEDLTHEKIFMRRVLCCSYFLPSGPGIPLPFVTTKIQQMLQSYFKSCLPCGSFPECTTPFSEELYILYLLSPALILVITYFVNTLHLLIALLVNYFYVSIMSNY